MQAILICELKGFALLSTSLAHKMEEISLTPERVRAGVVEILKDLIETLKPSFSVNQDFYIGGDTLVFTFNEIEEAVNFALSFNRLLLKLIVERGLYYIKPCLCIGYGNIKIQGERFLDDVSINVYRTADKNPPFTIWIAGQDAITRVERTGKYTLEVDSETHLAKLSWQALTVDSDLKLPEIAIPSLVLDSEMIFSNSVEDSVRKIRQYQADSKSILAFGGPIPFDSARNNEYLLDTIDIIKRKPKCKWTVISYLDLSDKKDSYYWLDLARRLSLRFNDRYTFTAYTVPKGVLIPFSYQIFDEETIHLGLRSYSAHGNKVTMNSAIIFKNTRVASRFKNEFEESYRKLGVFDDKKFSEVLKKISLNDKDAKKQCIELVDVLLK